MLFLKGRRKQCIRLSKVQTLARKRRPGRRPAVIIKGIQGMREMKAATESRAGPNGGKPVTHFHSIHERVGCFSAGPDVPVVCASDCIGYQKLNRGKFMASEHRQGMAEDSSATLIKG